MKPSIVFAMLAIATFGHNCRAADPRHFFPPETRLVAVADIRQLADSPIKPWLSEIDRATLVFQMDLVKSTDRVWIAVSESYPAKTLLVLEGRYTPSKLEAKAQELAKDRKMAARVYRENQNATLVLAFEPGIAANPIPGFPATLYVTALNADTIIIGFEKESIVDASRRKPGTTGRVISPVEPYLSQLNLDASLSIVGVPTMTVTGPEGLLAGVKLFSGSIRLNGGVASRWSFSADKSDSAKQMADRLQAGLDQARQVFGPLAKQQNIDARIVAWVNVILSSMRIEAKHAAAEVVIDIPPAAWPNR